MRLDCHGRQVEFSSNVLVAQPFLEKLQDGELGRCHQLCSSLEVIRAHERDRVARSPDLPALHDAKRLEQVWWIGSEQKIASRAGAENFGDRIEAALISGSQQICVRENGLQMSDDRKAKIDEK